MLKCLLLMVEQEAERDCRLQDDEDGTSDVFELPEVTELRHQVDQLNVELSELRDTVQTVVNTRPYICSSSILDLPATPKTYF